MPGGMVCAPQPLAVEAGAAILAAGGNAVDAAIAAAFVQGVVDPQMCGLGGGGTATVMLPGSQGPRVLDFYARAPLSAAPDMFAGLVESQAGWGGFILRGRVNEIGYRSVCTPCFVPGMGALHATHGRMPWADLLAPAIAVALEGAPVYHHVHERWMRSAAGFVDSLTRHAATPACAAQYMRDGRMLAPGERMDTRDYARTLQRLATAGVEDFVTGESARAMAADMAAHGGLVGLDDLAAAVPAWREPVAGVYRGHTVLAPPPPGGGVAVLAALNVLSRHDVGALAHNGAAHLHLVAGAIRHALDDWKRHTGDPAFVDSPLEWLLSPARAAEIDRAVAGGPAPPAGPSAVPDGRDTTQVSVIDGEGGCVSMTHTLALGSGVVTPGLGFMYNDAMMLFDPRPGSANSIAPGRIRQHATSCCLVLRDGRPVMAVGAPGGHGIVSGVVQTLSNVLDFGMSPVEAVSAPRIHCESDVIDAEARIPRGVVRELESLGHGVRHAVFSYDFASGRPHLVVRDPVSGACRGGADPRGGGMALAG